MPYNLTELIEQGEGTRLEFKSAISTAHRIARTVTAFANTAGGTLIVGVTDDGKIAGVDSELHEIRKIEQATDFFVEPAILISYETMRIDGRLVLLIDVPESTDKPHYAVDEQGNRTIYVRNKDKSVPTNKLIIAQESADNQLLQSPVVRTLIQFLRKNDSITAARMAQLVNISDQRATKLLRQLTEQGLLLMVDHPRPVRYSLKLSE
ncbi:putative transcriptional regulator [Fibrisoma limi BUZ 3]|uniref:Putative transcriptional regulator n=1 Tax=Fibrisoma limi BUZ 3 TaxID=1185876 RepID=I2GJ54_9BACT|nr:RNA-binding domain-containing protein [Fibrisoma limi]CCH53929.1 putative transcriptional regulator [Fibrisoma limi BUZ 3]